ncbi:hypothetical protein LXJ56_27530, partial [Escherichia coli]|nr:hypothetical protein [Escherichia coli]
VIFAPNPRQSVDQVVATKDRLVLVYNDNVRGRMAVYTPGTGGWTATPVALPDNVSLGVASADTKDDRGYVTVTGFLTPTTLLPLDAATASVGAPVKTLPAKFDAANVVVEQHEATSTDGTKVPYFIVHRKGV